MYQTFHSTPTWTLKGRTNSVTKSNNQANYPSPLDYTTEKQFGKTAPAFAVGKASRNLFSQALPNPGPGAYNVSTKVEDGPKPLMRGRSQSSTKPSPGPTDYNPDPSKILNKEPVFSMKTKLPPGNLERSRLASLPAPGHYQIKDGCFSNPKGVIGTSKRKHLSEFEDTPGPAAYLTQDKLEKSKSIYANSLPKFSISKSPRKAFVDDTLPVPGPGSYEKTGFNEDNKKAKKGYTLRPQTTDLAAVQRSKVPGPGQYNPTQAQETQQGSIFGYHSEKRLTFIDSACTNKIPGPGTHLVSNDSKTLNPLYKPPTHAFSKSPRKPLYEFEKTPGPAQYQSQELTTKQTAPKFSISKSLQRAAVSETTKLENPGPTKYDPKIDLVKQTRRTTFTTSQKRLMLEKEKVIVPGVGNYNLRGKAAGPSWGFGSEQRKVFESPEKAKVPAAGQYEVRTKFPDPPAYMTTMAASLKSQN